MYHIPPATEESTASLSSTRRRATQDWLQVQRPYTLHKPVRKRYSTRPYKTGGIDQHWQSDLVEMIPYENVNDGYRYILTVIDLFSRHAWAVPLRNKSANEVAAAFRQLFAPTTFDVNQRGCRRMMVESLI